MERTKPAGSIQRLPVAFMPRLSITTMNRAMGQTSGTWNRSLAARRIIVACLLPNHDARCGNREILWHHRDTLSASRGMVPTCLEPKSWFLGGLFSSFEVLFGSL